MEEIGSLVLTRKRYQSIMIGDDIEITVTRIQGGQAWLAVSAPKSKVVHRREIYERIQEEKEDE